MERSIPERRLLILLGRNDEKPHEVAKGLSLSNQSMTAWRLVNAPRENVVED